MIKGIKIRLEPNNKQNTKMFQYAGAKRFAYNWTLARQEENYKNGSKFIKDGDLRKEFTQLKKQEQYKWLNSISNNVTKQAIKDCCEAYKKFFKKLAEKPKFKSKKHSPPKFYQDTDKIQFTETHVKFEGFASSKKNNKQKLNWIKLSEKNRIPTGDDVKYINPRVSFYGMNWYISVGVEVENENTELSNESLGIDVGVKDLAVCSNGIISKNINKKHKIKNLEKKMRRLQRRISRKYIKNKEGESYVKTSNIIKLEKEIVKLHVKLANIRTNYRHEESTKIVRIKPVRVVMECLNIKGMMKNRHLSKAISQQGLYEFKTMIKYKAERYGIEFVEADKWFPSSKLCSCCGNIKKDLKLSDRVYKCECGNVMDRDFQASVNLSRYELVV